MTGQCAFIFDLDGTLLDSIKDLALTANDGLVQADLPPLPEPVYYNLVGNGIPELCRRSIVLSRLQQAKGKEAIYLDEHYNLPPKMLAAIRNPEKNEVEADLLSAFTGDFMLAYRHNWNRHTVPFPGMVKLLDRLAQAGIPAAVLSNKDDSFVQEICARFFAGDRLTTSLGDRADWPAKPDPTGALFLAKQMNCSPADVFFVGDSDVDMVTAGRAGMKPVAVSWGFRSVEELLSAGAVHLVHQPEELAALVNLSLEEEVAGPVASKAKTGEPAGAAAGEAVCASKKHAHLSDEN